MLRAAPASGATASGPAEFDFASIPIHAQGHAGGQGALTISAPGDAHEREADRVAEQMIGSSAPAKQGPCTCGGVCPRCRTPAAGGIPAISRVARGAESGAAAAPPVVHDVLASPGRPLGTAERAYFEPRFGQDLSHVRVHTGAHAAQSAQAIDAVAYTAGSHVVFGAGAAPGRNAVTAHELTHVLQQGQGASPTRVQRQMVQYDRYLHTGGYKTAGCLLDVKEESKGPTQSYMATACERGDYLTSAAGVEYIPEDRADAFGHCWVGCQGAKSCKESMTRLYGRGYEIFREVLRFGTFGLAAHNSYTEDNFNREYGVKTAERDRGGDCSEACDRATTGRALKFHGESSDVPEGVSRVYLCSETTINGINYGRGWKKIPTSDLLFGNDALKGR